MTTKEADLAARIDRLEAEGAIRSLVARYCFSIDDHDLATVAGLFCADARVRSLDGVMDATGRDAIVAQYKGRFAALGPSNHVSHDHVVIFDSADPDRATGLVSAHAELWRNGQMMITALRYNDRYRREDGVWCFAERVLSFLYYIPVADYSTILGSRDRMRAYDIPQSADYPERIPGWRDYRG